MMRYIAIAISLLHIPSIAQETSNLPAGNWKLIYSQEFNDNIRSLDEHWNFQNSPTLHTLSSRWRDNIIIENGIAKLIVKKETRAGQNWTAASMHTKKKFKYGFFEARYRYADTTGTNNSFWLMPIDWVEKKNKRGYIFKTNKGEFEIDINEGWHPNNINTNVHNHITGNSRKKRITIKNISSLSDDFHTYALDWTPNELIWYFDGREIRRTRNDCCHKPAHIWLSLAVLSRAGKITNNMDGKSMDVDFVRVFKETEYQ